MQAQSPKLQWNKILLPIELPDQARRIVEQTAFLARHFRSEIILLHVESSLRDDGLGELDPALRRELDGIAVRRLLLKGDPAREIGKMARDEKVDMIAMSTHGHGVVYRFLLGSVAAKVLHDSVCPVWTSAHVAEVPAREFSIQNVLCAVDLSPHSNHTVSRAALVAADFGARLTLVHVTDSVEMYGPGGSHVLPEWKEVLVSYATKEIAKLQQDTGVKADVFIGSGDVPKLLSQAATQTKADLLVTGCNPYGGHLRKTHGYGIICAVPIPVLSV